MSAQMHALAAPTPDGRPSWRCVQTRPLLALRGELCQATGIAFGLYGADAQPLHPADPPDPGNPLLVLAAQHQDRHRASLVQRAMDTGAAAVTESPTGIVHLAVPVPLGGRVIGAGVGSYVCTEALEPGTLHELGTRVGLVPEQCASHLTGHVTYSRHASEHLGATVTLLFEFQQGNLVKEREITELTTNLLTTYEEISLLYKIGSSITVASSSDEIIRLVCSELLDALDVETLAAVGVNASGPTRSVGGTLVMGERTVSTAQLRNLYLLYVEQQAGGKPFIENHFQTRQQLAHFYPGVRSIMIVPMIAGGETLSALLAINKRAGHEFGSNDAKLVCSIANEAAAQLKNAQLYEDLRSLLYSVVRALSSAIDAKDPYTCGHSERVAFLSRTLAERMGMAHPEAEEVYLAGLLHDIGKIGIKEDILQKTGRLTDEEMAHIRQHPEIGARILCNLKHLEGVLPGVRHHHERLDGTGYPAGLEGDQIPQIGRIISVADGFDAMTSNRPYRYAKPEAEAVTELERSSGTQYDSAIVELFIRMIAEEEFRSIYSNMTADAVVGE